VKRTGEARTVTPPASKSSEPYKAIVYIYLGGGLDSFNLLTPGSQGCTSLYNSYFQARGGKEGVGLTADDMLTIDGSSAGINGCSTFGVNKLMSAYKQIFDEGKGIFLANMGVRVYSSNRSHICLPHPILISPCFIYSTCTNQYQSQTGKLKPVLTSSPTTR
jgi:uncharacterized protein (DUF1501 family)